MVSPCTHVLVYQTCIEKKKKKKTQADTHFQGMSTLKYLRVETATNLCTATEDVTALTHAFSTNIDYRIVHVNTLLHTLLTYYVGKSRRILWSISSRKNNSNSPSVSSEKSSFITPKTPQLTQSLPTASTPVGNGTSIQKQNHISKYLTSCLLKQCFF